MCPNAGASKHPILKGILVIAATIYLKHATYSHTIGYEEKKRYIRSNKIEKRGKILNLTYFLSISTLNMKFLK